MLERITRQERYDLLIAWLAIALAFTLIFIRGGADPISFLVYFVISLLTVGVGFVLHEMAHKFTAMKYGFRAEFRKDNQMLLVAVALAALAGIVFAAPGATVISGNYPITREQNGRISAAGPITNLVLCIPFLGLVMAGVLLPAGLPAFLLTQLGVVGLTVNAMIAAFNMIPVSVLDGKKVLAWNPAIFGVLITSAFLMVLFSQDFGGWLTAFLALFL
jgi:Zn-dependent protease